MITFDLVYGGMCAAWNMLVDHPLPGFLVPQNMRGVPARYVMLAFPLVGAVVGALLSFAAAVSAALFNPVAGGTVFVLLMLLALEWKDSGRGLSLLISFFSGRLRGRTHVEALREMSNCFDRLNHPGALLLLVGIVLLKAIFLTALYCCHSSLWAVVILAGAFTVQGVLAAAPELKMNTPLLRLNAEERKGIWYSAVAVLIAMMFVFPVSAVVAGGAVFGLAIYFRRTLSNVNADIGDMITLSGTLSECVLMIVGILFAIRIG